MDSQLQTLYEFSATVEADTLSERAVHHMIRLQAHPLRAVRVLGVAIDLDDLREASALRVRFLADQRHLRGYEQPKVESIDQVPVRNMTQVSCRLRNVPGDEYIPGLDIAVPALSRRHEERFEAPRAPVVSPGETIDAVLETGKRPVGRVAFTVFFDE